MKKFFIFAIGLCLSFSVACSSSKKNKKDDKQVKSSSSDSSYLSVAYDTLKKRPIYGFAYKKSIVAMDVWDAWINENQTLIEKLLPKLPKGYVMQVTGHADASGPEYPVGKKPGNIKISTERALSVYNLLLSRGLDPAKLTYKGLGSKNLIPEEKPKAAKQRRVTFLIVPDKK